MKKKIVTFLALVIVLSVNAQEKKWTLQECVEYALSNNISIKQQELVSELVKEDITTAEGNFYPSLNASLSHRYNFGSYIDISGSRVSRDSRSNGAGISTGATLYNGKRNKNLLIQAEKNDHERYHAHELDYDIHGGACGVFEGVAYRVADHGGLMRL